MTRTKTSEQLEQENQHLRDKVLELERRDALFRAQQLLFDQTLEFLGVLSSDGAVLRANAPALALAGVTEQDVHGLLFWHGPWWRHDPVQQTRVREAVALARDGETVAFETTHMTADGQILHVDFAIKPMRDHDGSIVNLIAEGRDITLRIEAESARHESEKRYRALFENAGDAILIMSEERIIDCNRKALELFGCTYGDLIGHSPCEFSPPTQPDGRDSRDKARAKISAAYEGETQSFEWTHARFDRTLVDAEVTLSSFGTPPGALLLAIVRDITGRKTADEQLKLALEELTRLRDSLQKENVTLRNEVQVLHGERRLIGDSPTFQHALGLVAHVAGTDSTVLLAGETGTGKELFATEIHARSRRSGRPMVRVNCAALPANLIESELFGRDRGAFTGATSRQIGRFEMASGSTIFLDEIGELPLDVQVKILRVLQEKEFERLGSPTPIKVDVRIIAATNRDLEAEVQAGRFRRDLFYRLNVFPIVVPPLRDRAQDIPTLVWAFVEEFSKSLGKRITAIPPADLAALATYRWPGNIRELRNIIERSMIMATGSELHVRVPGVRRTLVPGRQGTARPPKPEPDTERDRIRRVLESCGWRIRGAGGAAEILGLKPTTLETRMARLSITRPGKSRLR